MTFETSYLFKSRGTADKLKAWVTGGFCTCNDLKKITTQMTFESDSDSQKDAML